MHSDRRLLLGQTGQLGDGELALLQHEQQVVGQVQVALVEFVDQQQPRLLLMPGGQRGAQGPQAYEAADVGGAVLLLAQPGPMAS